jgi:hypothetical protein
VQLASPEDPIALVQFCGGDRFRDLERDGQSDVDRLDDPGGHLWGGVPVAGADAAATLQLPAAAALVPHQLIDHPGQDAFVLQPGRKAVPKIVGSAKLQMRKVASSAAGLRSGRGGENRGATGSSVYRRARRSRRRDR